MDTDGAGALCNVPVYVLSVADTHCAYPGRDGKLNRTTYRLATMHNVTHTDNRRTTERNSRPDRTKNGRLIIFVHVSVTCWSTLLILMAVCRRRRLGG